MQKVDGLKERIKKERMVLQGAMKLLQQASSSNKPLVEASVQESKSRLEFLEAELKKLQLPITSDAPVTIISGNSTTSIISTNFGFLLNGNLSNDLVTFRLKQIKSKLGMETRVRVGIENMLGALTDTKTKADMQTQCVLAKNKEVLLQKASQRYQLLKTEESEDVIENPTRLNGRLKCRLMEASNLTGRKSIKEDIVAQIFIDGVCRHTTRYTKGKWDDLMDVKLEKAADVEILVKERDDSLIALSWFKLKDLNDYLTSVYPHRSIETELPELVLDMEPFGQLSLKLNFIPFTQRTQTTTEMMLSRRDGVDKVYPRNGHRFIANRFYQILKCAVCNEFLGRQGYQCKSCLYLCHAKCYDHVITKCLPPGVQVDDTNTGQLLKYKIPHRFDSHTSLGTNWCHHCGFICVGRCYKCAECHQTAHRDCVSMIPHFCGLDPKMAETLVIAFEEAEKKKIQKELEQSEQAFPSSATMNRQSLLRRKASSFSLLKASVKITIDDFQLVSVIGRGAFGKVMLAKEKSTQRHFAIKTLKKEFILQNEDIKNLNLEKSIFKTASAIQHPFLLNLHSTFQSDTRVYFVMEYVAGGDLMTLIQQVKKFGSQQTKFFACEILLALEYFHMNHIIYRDLKLDNVLLGTDGHVKVADYGICKENMPFGSTTFTFCGTPDYMAPEILLNKRYGVAVDWWAFGIFIYICLFGRYPFRGNDENEILEAILSDAIDFPASTPKETLSLLQSLLTKNPSRRLGAGPNDSAQIKSHPYFIDVDWDAFMEKKVKPPFIPHIKDDGDVSNFDSEFTRELPVLTPIHSILGEVEQKEFNDFDYVSDWAIKDRL